MRYHFFSIVLVSGIFPFLGDYICYPPSPPKVHELIAKLGAQKYKVRAGSTRQLQKIGFSALHALYWARYNSDPEVALRAKYIYNAYFYMPVPYPEIFRMRQHEIKIKNSKGKTVTLLNANEVKDIYLTLFRRAYGNSQNILFYDSAIDRAAMRFYVVALLKQGIPKGEIIKLLKITKKNMITIPQEIY